MLKRIFKNASIFFAVAIVVGLCGDWQRWVQMLGIMILAGIGLGGALINQHFPKWTLLPLYAFSFSPIVLAALIEAGNRKNIPGFGLSLLIMLFISFALFPDGKSKQR